MTNDVSERHPVDELAEEFVARYRRGERPAVSEYVRRFPELASQIQEVLQALVMIEEVAPAANSSGHLGRLPSGQWQALERLGEYRILREVGRGGMGIVYQAEQESLGRQVALKVLPYHAHMDVTQLERFRREAKAAARLHHTNIVPVFGVGEQDGIHYYAMQYIQGQGLDQVLKEVKRLRESIPQADEPTGKMLNGDSESKRFAQLLLAGEFVDTTVLRSALRSDGLPQADGAISITAAIPQSNPSDEERILPVDAGQAGARSGSSGRGSPQRYFRSVARIGIQVADALEYAHAQGVLHRDIKPSNLLLDLQGTVWITDFGLAKTDDSENLTLSGDVVGTLRYMAPERFRGRSDTRSDVYSLGMTLYEMLAQRPAFDGSDRGRLIQQVTSQEPARLRKWDRSLPKDLETIIHKAVAKEPGGRYAQAKDLADDLRRFLVDKPILARRARVIERSWRWCRRNPAVAALLVALLLVLLGGFSGVLSQWLQARQNLAQADRQHARAEQNLRLALKALDQVYMRMAENHFTRDPKREREDRELLQQGLRFYTEFAEQNQDDASAQWEAAQAFERAGWLYRQLDQHPLSEETYQRAISLLEKLAQANPQRGEYRSLMASCHHTRAAIFLWEAKNRDEAEKSFLRSIAIGEQLCAEFPNVAKYQRDYAAPLAEYGVMLRSTDRIREGEEAIRRALAIQLQLVQQFPGDREHEYFLARTQNYLGRLLMLTGRPTEAEQEYRRALAWREKHVQTRPKHRVYRQDLARIYHELGRLLATRGSLAEAEECLRKAIDVTKQLVQEFPNIPKHRADLANSQQVLAEIQSAHGSLPAGTLQEAVPAQGQPAP